MVVVAEPCEGAMVARAAGWGGEGPIPAQELRRAARELRQEAVGAGAGVEVGRVVGRREVVELEWVGSTRGVPVGVVLVVVGVAVACMGGERGRRGGLGGSGEPGLRAFAPRCPR